MAGSLFSASALVSNTTSTCTTPPHLTSNNNNNKSVTVTALQLQKTALSKVAAVAVTAVVVSAATPCLAEAYSIYYGTAASAANYGGYGGNSSKKESAEYIYDVPEGWKERLVSKVEKGTNGTDSEFYNPKKKTEREYLTFLAGFRQLAPKDVILNNLALSDVNLQDLIADAEKVSSFERISESGQLYYDYEIDSASSHSLISVTCSNNKLFAHFVNAPSPEWTRDQDLLRHLHLSFKTLV